MNNTKRVTNFVTIHLVHLTRIQAQGVTMAHLYRMGTDKGTLEVEANNRTQAAAIAKKHGYTVNDCNMIG